VSAGPVTRGAPGAAQRAGAADVSRTSQGPSAPQGTGAADDVDRVIAAWRRERPDLDLAPLAVLSRVSRLARRLDRAREVAFARHELAVWEFDVLVALRRTGPPYRLTPGQLLAETLVTSGTMTNRIDRLETRALVVREPVPDDRRGTWVALTDEGRSRVDGAFTDLLAEERDLLAVLAPEDQSDLAASLRHLLLQFESPPPPHASQI
jgi:DNA-binding MarR family transcriptional regulator